MENTEEAFKKEYIKWLQENLDQYIYLDDAAWELKEKIKGCSLEKEEDIKKAEMYYQKFAKMLCDCPLKAIFGIENRGIVYKDVRYGLYKDRSKKAEAVPFPFFLQEDHQQIIQNRICNLWTKENQKYGKQIVDDHKKNLKMLAICYGEKLNGFYGFPTLEKLIKLICGSFFLLLSAMMLLENLRMLGDGLVSVLSCLTALFSMGYFLWVLKKDAKDLLVVNKIERYWKYSIKEIKIVKAKTIEIEAQLEKIRKNIKEKKYFNEEFDNLYLDAAFYTENKWLRENDQYIKGLGPWPEPVLKRHHFLMLLLVVFMLFQEKEEIKTKIEMPRTAAACINDMLEPVKKRNMDSFTADSYQYGQIELQKSLTAKLIRDTDQASKGEVFCIRSCIENESGEPVISGKTNDGTEISVPADSLMIYYPGCKYPTEAEGYTEEKTTIKMEDLMKLTDRRTSTVWTGEDGCLAEFTFHFDAEQEDTMIDMLHISNGNLTSLKSYHENSRIREVKISVNDEAYYTVLEDTFNPLGYNIPFPKTVIPGTIEIEVTDVYHGERNDKLSIAGFDFYKT